MTKPRGRKPPPEKREDLHIYLPIKMVARLRDIAVASDRPVTSLAREAIRTWLEARPE